MTQEGKKTNNLLNKTIWNTFCSFKTNLYICILMKQTITITPNSKTVATLQKMITLKKEYREIVVAKVKASKK